MLGVYCRISQLKELNKDQSINDQRLSGIELANKLKIPYKVYIDEGLSGTANENDRPSLKNLLNDITDGMLTAVFVYDQSRLERSPIVRFQLQKVFKENDIDLYTIEGKINDSITDEFTGDILSVINNFYVKQTSKKIKSVLKRNAEAGRIHGISPYGYTKDENGKMILDELEASIVRRIFEMSLSGIGQNKIAEILNSEDVPTRYNKIGSGTITTIDHLSKVKRTKKKIDIKWAGGTINKIIKNTIYKGERYFSGLIYEVPEIVTPVHWQKVNNNLKNNRNNSGKKSSYNYLLRGKIICGKCGRNYCGKTRQDKSDHFYMCSSKRIKKENCGNRSINIDAIENFIWNRFFVESELKNKLLDFFNNTDLEISIDVIETDIERTEKKLRVNHAEQSKVREYLIKGIFDENDSATELKRLKIAENDLKIELQNLKDELTDINNSIHSEKEFLNELSNLKNNTSFNKKKLLVDKFIRNIHLVYEKKKDKTEIGVFIMIVSFNLIGVENEYYLMPDNYHIAFNVLGGDNDDGILIPISKIGNELVKNLNNEIAKEHDNIQFKSKLDEFYNMFRCEN